MDHTGTRLILCNNFEWEEIARLKHTELDYIEVITIEFISANNLHS